MAKQNLLLVDADQRSLRVLEVSLRKAGYSVTTCADAPTAIEMVGMSRPDMIISDTRLPEVDGFQLVERLRESEESRDIPFMFLSSDGSVESKVKGLELGVQDYLTKPIYIKEIITRVNLELQRRQRVGLERKSVETKTRFSGSLADMGLVDLLQTIDISRKSGVLHLTSPAGQRGAIYFDVGGLKHAELGKLRGDWALYRALVWNEGNFELEFRPVRLDEETISMSTQGLLMEGMRRLDEWGRLLEQLPPLDAVFEIDEAELRDRLAEIPDEINDVLKYFDGVRSLMDVVDEVAADDLETLAAISKLYFEGLIVDSGMRTSLITPAAPPHDGGADSGEDADHEMDEEAAAMAAAGVVPGESGELLVSSGETPLEPEEFGQTLPATATAPSRGPAALAGMRAADSQPPPARERPQRERSDTSPGIAAGDIAQAQRERDEAERAIGTLGDDPALVGDETASSASSPADAAPSEPERNPDTDGRPTAVDPVYDVLDTPSLAPAASPSVAPPSSPTASVPPPPPVELPVAVDAPEEARDVRASRTPSEGLPGNVIRFPHKGGAALALAEPEPEEPTPEAVEPPRRDPAEDETNRASKPNATDGESGPHARPSDVGVAAVAVGVPVPEAADSPARTSLPVADSIPTRAGAHEGKDPSDFSDEFFVAESYESTRASQVVARAGQAVTEAGEVAEPLPPTKSQVVWRYLGLLTAAAVIVFFVYHLATRDREGRFGDIGQPAHVVSPTLRPVGPNEAPEADPAAAPTQEAEPEVAEAPTPPVEPEVAAVEEPVVPPVAEVAPPAAAPSAALEQALATARAARSRDEQAAWEAVLVIQPNSAEALEELGWIAINRRQNAQARDYARRAVAVDPTLSRAWVTLGAALQELDDDAGARLAYQSCVDHGVGANVRDCRTMLRMLGSP